MKFEKYKFRDYSSTYPVLFKREKYKLKKILPSDAKIEHIGSTAVFGLGGKGIIDIVISVKKQDIDRSKIKLQEAGYLFRSYAGNSERMLFSRDYKYRGNIRKVHLHLTFHNSSEFNKKMAFVAYLKSNSSAVKEYADIKKKAAKIANGDRDIYKEFKGKFLKILEKKADEFSKLLILRG